MCAKSRQFDLTPENEYKLLTNCDNMKCLFCGNERLKNETYYGVSLKDNYWIDDNYKEINKESIPEGPEINSYPDNSILNLNIFWCTECENKATLIYCADFCNDIQSAFETLKMLRVSNLITTDDFKSASNKYLKKIIKRTQSNIKHYN